MTQSIQDWLNGLRVYDLPDSTWEERYQESTGKIPMVIAEVKYHKFITHEAYGTMNKSRVQLEVDLESTLEPMTETQLRDAGVVAIVRTAQISSEPTLLPKGSHQMFKAYAVGHYEKK